MYYVKLDLNGDPIDGLILKENLAQIIGDLTDQNLLDGGFARVLNVTMPQHLSSQYVTEGPILKNPDTGVIEKTWVIHDYTQAELVDMWIRGMRDRLLITSDWTQTVDAPLTAAKKSEWAAYRTQLRDMTLNPGVLTTFESIVWPTQPTK